MSETFRPSFPDVPNPPYPRISYGLPFHEACAKHIENTFHAKKAYIIASTSLSTRTPFLGQLQGALGPRLIGTWVGIKAHTPLHELVPLIHDMRQKRADCLITLGGGSLTDGAKIITYALANHVHTKVDLQALAVRSTTKDADQSAQSRGHAPTVPIICIPISLSGGEYSKYGGATDTPTGLKRIWTHDAMFPSLVILDPVLTVQTPEKIWLSTGVRAIDHCVEGYLSHLATRHSDRAAEKGLKLLLPSLLATKRDPADLQARLKSQLGANLSMQMLYLGVWMGASHGIGHQLGPMGVGHGETSCVLSPAVQKWNARVNGGKQGKLLEVLWAEEAVVKVLREAGVEGGECDLGDVLRAIFNALGMPRSLKEVGVGRDKLEQVAVNSLEDHFVRANPRGIETKEQVMEILEMCLE